jgi:uncharacterized membrane protein HdeD (DUF308 family)
MSDISVASGVGETARSLRTLYFVRVVFSVVWVVLVFSLASSALGGSTPSLVAGILLVVYPVWDVIATFFDIRANRTSTSPLPQYVNIVFGLAAAVAMIIALPIGGLTPAIIVFGVWAFVSGAVQLFLAIRRRRSLGGQWPMIVSGGLSVVAGISFVVMAGSPTTGLTTLAGYSAFGAFWYLVTAIWLTRSVRMARL